jgi:hypothetical protein
VFIAQNGKNEERIILTSIGKRGSLNLRFIPLTWPKAHRFIGRLLRIFWQYKVAKFIYEEGYDVIFQVSPNSIAYANPLFYLNWGPVKLIGPMRIEPWASIRVFYWNSPQVLLRQLFIKAKETLEWLVFWPMRVCIKRYSALHLSPFAVDAKLSKQLYCRETALIEIEVDKISSSGKWLHLIWSGHGDAVRKNEHLARRIVTKLLHDIRFANASITILGSTLSWPKDDRIEVFDKLARSALVRSMTNRTVYLCTSLLEINSVLAEEVLIMGGSVVAGPLRGFIDRSDDSRIGIVRDYSNPAKWIDKIFESREPLSDTLKSINPRDVIVERIVERILAVDSIAEQKDCL